MPEYTDVHKMLVGDWIKIHWGIDVFKFFDFFYNFGFLGIYMELFTALLFSVIMTVLIVRIYDFIASLIKTEKLPKEINPDEK
jgi:hypothetical protein